MATETPTLKGDQSTLHEIKEDVRGIELAIYNFVRQFEEKYPGCQVKDIGLLGGINGAGRRVLANVHMEVEII